MRIAFVGKGGSGKTTIASLLARHLAARKLPVLAIDADINQHLAGAIGMPADVAETLPPLGIEMNRIKEYLRGTNERIRSTGVMMKTTPPGAGSRFIRLGEQNPIFDHFERSHEGVRLMAVGTFTEEDLGIKCYHSKTGAVELLLNHLIDTKGEYVIVDMTAGADSFASGLFTKFDLTLLVVEPTLKSLSVYEQYRKYAASYGVLVRVVGNKIESDDDIAFIRGRVGDDLIGLVYRSDFIRSMEKGLLQPIEALEEGNQKVLRDLVRHLDACERDWKQYYAHAIHFHEKNAKSWASAQMGEDLTEQIDPTFDIESIVSPALS